MPRKPREKAVTGYVAPPVKDPSMGYENVKKFLPTIKQWPKWHSSDWSVVEYPHSYKGEAERTAAHDLAKALELPEGINVAMAFKAKCECLPEVTSYTQFKSPRALQTFADTTGKLSLRLPAPSPSHTLVGGPISSTSV